MSAIEKERIEQPMRKLGILAGGGDLPRMLIQSCYEQGIEPFVVAFEGQTHPETVENVPHLWTRLGAAGLILKTLKSHDVADLVMIGSIRRPSLAELRPDVKGAQILTRIGLSSFGDDRLLRSLRLILEEEGIRIHGVQRFVKGLLGTAGALGKIKPSKKDHEDIVRGVEILKHMAVLDIGQGAIIQQGLVLGLEAAEGTDALIRRCADYKRKGEGGVLIKLPKSGQDHDLDMPAIGATTIENIAAAGLAGICFQAGATLLIHQEELAELADRHKVFLYGLNLETS